MLKITVELIAKDSAGITREETLARAYLYDSDKVGEIKAKFSDPIDGRFETSVIGFNRFEESVWKLLWRSLDKYFGDLR